MTACSRKRVGVDNPELSCIRLVKDDQLENFFLPLPCMHCSDPPCLAVCPREALYRDEVLSRVMVNPARCIGCKMCCAACPFGAVGFDSDRGNVFKCDLCGGDPECVRICKPGALTFVETPTLQAPFQRSTAERFTRAMAGRHSSLLR